MEQFEAIYVALKTPKLNDQVMHNNLVVFRKSIMYSSWFLVSTSIICHLFWNDVYLIFGTNTETWCLFMSYSSLITNFEHGTIIRTGLTFKKKSFIKICWIGYTSEVETDSL